jgi:single-strand selective monofunctional uracil DNA glycosylase
VNPAARVETLLDATLTLRREVDAIPLCGADVLRKGFGPLSYVYDPLEYAWDIHRQFVERYGGGSHRPVVLVGMNPGPWGMGQTGVPFGDPAVVRDWLGLEGEVSQPRNLCPGRPVLGLASKRREESGTTLYGWARARFETAERFFSQFWIVNYCPLLMFDRAGKNVTPSDFRKGSVELQQLLAVCDRHLLAVIRQFQPSWVIGIGQFAELRASAAVTTAKSLATTGCIIHPSPQTRGHWGAEGWGGLADAKLRQLGVSVTITGS